MIQFTKMTPTSFFFKFVFINQITFAKENHEQNN